MRALGLCDACKRHIRANEFVCPFCGAAYAQKGAVVERKPRGRPGGRAALFLVGVTATVGSGCDIEIVGAKTNMEDHPDAAAQDAGEAADAGASFAECDAASECEEPSVPVYGIPIDAGSEQDATNDGGEPNSVPVYGIPVDAGSEQDAASECEEPSVPVYGIPIDAGSE